MVVALGIRGGRGLRVESVMLRNNLPMNNVPRVELDHRAREARLRLERVAAARAASCREARVAQVAYLSDGQRGHSCR